jgi:hypothetical protein
MSADSVATFVNNSEVKPRAKPLLRRIVLHLWALLGAAGIARDPAIQSFLNAQFF